MSVNLWVDQVVQDVRYALRTFRRQPIFAAIASLTLAVGIGMTAAIFSVMNAVALRPLGYPDADRLVWLSTVDSGSDPGHVIGPDFVDWREQARSFDRMTAYGTADYALVAPRGSGRVRAAMVTEDFWTLSGARPEAGRLPALNARDEVLVTRHFARQWFAADADAGADADADAKIIGRPITLDGQQMTIVGVLPEHFQFHLHRLHCRRPEIFTARSGGGTGSIRPVHGDRRRVVCRAGADSNGSRSADAGADPPHVDRGGRSNASARRNREPGAGAG